MINLLLGIREAIENNNRRYQPEVDQNRNMLECYDFLDQFLAFDETLVDRQNKRDVVS